MDFQQELTLTSARFVLGLLSSDQPVQLANKALDSNIYSDTIFSLFSIKSPTWAEVEPLFLSWLSESKIQLPSKDEAVWILLRFHIRQIADGIVPPRTGLSEVVTIYLQGGLHELSANLAGDSHHIQFLYGAYYEYDDICGGISPSLISNPNTFTEISQLDKQVCKLAAEWCATHAA